LVNRSYTIKSCKKKKKELEKNSDALVVEPRVSNGKHFDEVQKTELAIL